MNKRRVTLNLDEDIVAALEHSDARSLSAAANAALRQAVASASHRRALLTWLTDLNAEFGAPTAADLADADRLLDESGFDGGVAAPQDDAAA